jgi:hypothetical protein
MQTVRFSLTKAARHFIEETQTQLNPEHSRRFVQLLPSLGTWALVLAILVGGILIVTPGGLAGTAQVELLHLAQLPMPFFVEDNDLHTTVAYSPQMIYEVTQEQDCSEASVLVRSDEPATTTAAADVQHTPTDAPAIIFINEDGTTLNAPHRDNELVPAIYIHTRDQSLPYAWMLGTDVPKDTMHFDTARDDTMQALTMMLTLEDLDNMKPRHILE